MTPVQAHQTGSGKPGLGRLASQSLSEERGSLREVLIERRERSGIGRVEEKTRVVFKLKMRKEKKRRRKEGVVFFMVERFGEGNVVLGGGFKGRKKMMGRRSAFLECWVLRVFHDDCS